MFASRGAGLCVFWLWACSSPEQTRVRPLEAQETDTSEARAPNESSASPAPSPSSEPSSPASGGSAEAPEDFLPELVTFMDPASGFETQRVHDADRDVVHFDLENRAMIWSESADGVTGWVTEGNDLRWDRSGVAFRVRFGSEGGNRRAFFTETGAGTICNLDIAAPEQLSISATRETPPNP